MSHYLYSNIRYAPAFLMAGALFFCACAYQCSQAPPTTGTTASVAAGLPYNLAQPTRQVALQHPGLREISGLSPLPKSEHFMAIADEAGILYELDLSPNASKVVVDSFSFRPKGDFEGVEMCPVNSLIYAIKSDGKVYEFNLSERSTAAKEFATPLSESDDIEGLGYDGKRHQLLVIAKGDPDSQAARSIWTFDPTTRQLSTTPIIRLPHNLTDALVPRDEDLDGDKPFSPSGIAVHPITGDYYIISSSLKRIAVINPENGQLKAALRLDKKVFAQPEGIAFAPNGTLYISNEAKKEAPAKILIFDMQQR
jgi:uncharacterized protein YjiK